MKTFCFGLVWWFGEWVFFGCFFGVFFCDLFVWFGFALNVGFFLPEVTILIEQDIGQSFGAGLCITLM